MYRLHQFLEQLRGKTGPVEPALVLNHKKNGRKYTITTLYLSNIR